MREIEVAFSRAMEQKSNSPIDQKNNNGYQRQTAERIRLREEEQFTQLKKQFKKVGHMWFDTRIDQQTGILNGYDGIPEQKMEEWTHVLTSLRNKPSEQRIELLEALASGMQLTKRNTAPSNDAKYTRAFRFTSLGYSGDKLFGISFTRPSMFFMEGISDMLNHSIEQKQEFREFMIRDAGLKGRVKLPELFPGISRWLDHK